MDFISAIDYVKNLPYGRNQDKQDLLGVLSDRLGTCSTKHALLKQLADENQQEDVRLYIGLYKMSAINTPHVGITLEKYQLDYLPEAHCYLHVRGMRVDVTRSDSKVESFLRDLIEEVEILPHQVSKEKVDYHRLKLDAWRKAHGVPYSLEEVWQIREQCILDLSKGLNT